MACSKLSPDVLDIKVHYSYHGGERCALVDTTFNNLYGMDYVTLALLTFSRMKFLNFLSSKLSECASRTTKERI